MHAQRKNCSTQAVHVYKLQDSEGIATAVTRLERQPTAAKHATAHVSGGLSNERYPSATTVAEAIAMIIAAAQLPTLKNPRRLNYECKKERNAR